MPGWDSNTKLLIKFDGADGTNSYTAETGQIVSFNANAQLDTADKKFGTSSLLLDGDADYITIPDSSNWAFSGDFTIDFWMKQTAGGDASQTLYGQGNTDSYYGRLYLEGGEFKFNMDNTIFTYSSPLTTSGASILAGSWYHIALVRNSNTYKIYVNGTERASGSESDSFPDYSGAIAVGCLYYGSTRQDAFDFKGWVDEYRISNVARWTANFTPSTVEYLKPIANQVFIL